MDYNGFTTQLQPLNNSMFYTVTIMRFGEWLREQRSRADLTLKQLAARCGVSFSYISALERQQPHSLTGKDIQPKLATVDRLARALGVPIDEARLAAGYAPKYPLKAPETIKELAAVLDKLGVSVPIETFPDDPHGDGFVEILERIRLDFELVVNRLERGKRPAKVMNITIARDDWNNEDVEELQLKRK